MLNLTCVWATETNFNGLGNESPALQPVEYEHLIELADAELEDVSGAVTSVCSRCKGCGRCVCKKKKGFIRP